MNMPNVMRCALTGAAVLGAATGFAGVTVLGQATSEPMQIDNLEVRMASPAETLVLPEAWGVADAPTLTLAGRVVVADGSNYVWKTGPLPTGDYPALLDYGEKQFSAIFRVEALESADSELAEIDNAFEADPAGDDVRKLANHTNVFRLAWTGAGEPVLTLDGEATGATPDADGDWAWQNSGLTYALYTFTNTVDGSNYVARFRVDSDKVAVRFGEATNDVLVAKAWYADYVQELGAADAREAISQSLKEDGANGLPLWKSYVLGVDPDAALDFKSDIRTFGSDPVIKSRFDEKGGTNIYYAAFTTNNIVVWPMVDVAAMPTDSQADVVYTLQAADAPTNAFETITSQSNDRELVDRFGVDERKQRFYKTCVDVTPTAK